MLTLFDDSACRILHSGSLYTPILLRREYNSTKSRFYVDDILYGKLRPYLDKAVLAKFEGICSTDILVMMRRAR